MSKKSKSFYLNEKHINLIKKLTEKHNISQSKVVEKAIEKVNEEGLNIPTIRQGKKGLKD